MAERNDFDHESPERQSPGDRTDAQGYDWSVWGENVFVGSGSAQVVYNDWKSSPGHNDNMLDPVFTETGIGRGYEQNSAHGWSWTIVFARPL